jgi:hypothetical protein
MGQLQSFLRAKKSQPEKFQLAPLIEFPRRNAPILREATAINGRQIQLNFGLLGYFKSVIDLDFKVSTVLLSLE